MNPYLPTHLIIENTNIIDITPLSLNKVIITLNNETIKVIEVLIEDF